MNPWDEDRPGYPLHQYVQNFPDICITNGYLYFTNTSWPWQSILWSFPVQRIAEMDEFNFVVTHAFLQLKLKASSSLLSLVMQFLHSCGDRPSKLSIGNLKILGYIWWQTNVLRSKQWEHASSSYSQAVQITQATTSHISNTDTHMHYDRNSFHKNHKFVRVHLILKKIIHAATAK